MQPNPLVRTGKAHRVTVVKGSWLHRVVCTTELAVNSLHNEGIDRLGNGLVVEATAPDGTIECIRAVGGPGLAVGVQWHPEYDWERDPLSRAILEAFAAAVRSRGMPNSAAAD
jgi:putative glutamine amidotransferase